MVSGPRVLATVRGNGDRQRSTGARTRAERSAIPTAHAIFHGGFGELRTATEARPLPGRARQPASQTMALRAMKVKVAAAFSPLGVLEHSFANDCFASGERLIGFHGQLLS